jgi:hypothetical protein
MAHHLGRGQLHHARLFYIKLVDNGAYILCKVFIIFELVIYLHQKYKAGLLLSLFGCCF